MSDLQIQKNKSRFRLCIVVVLNSSKQFTDTKFGVLKFALLKFSYLYPGGVCCGHQVPGFGRWTAHGVVPSGGGIGGLGASHDIKRLGDGYPEAIT